jgi:hypothetical protein
MPEDHSLPSRGAERAELDAVVEALVRLPRLARLVRCLGEKYFLGQTDQLHEYNIATEVFGRSKTLFDPSEDAIARVETNRLRKKLKEYYETEGKNHAVQISLPSGTYVPVFTHQTAAEPAPEPTLPSSTAPEPAAESGDMGFFFKIKRFAWVYALLAASAVLVALGIYMVAHLHGGSKAVMAGASAVQPSPAQRSGAPNTATVPLRLIAGYLGKPQTDSAGQLWNADRYFQNGSPWQRPQSSIARTSDPLLFDHWRTGNFSYDIPLAPGVYELHLFFAPNEHLNDSFSTFSVAINDNYVLSGFDPDTDAMGEDIADERVFRDLSPAQDGMLHVRFDNERGVPALNALEVLAGIPHKQLPVRLVMQPTPFTDHDGNLWRPDTYYMSGRISAQRQPITGSPDPGLFASERYGHFTYAIPVDLRGHYTLVLHFAEFYFGPHASGVGGNGSRVFRVMCNGVLLLDDFDIYKEAGSLHALTKTFTHLKPTAQGKLNLTFEPIVNNATVSGIEVLDESE